MMVVGGVIICLLLSFLIHLAKHGWWCLEEKGIGLTIITFNRHVSTLHICASSNSVERDLKGTIKHHFHQPFSKSEFDYLIHGGEITSISTFKFLHNILAMHHQIQLKSIQCIIKNS